MQLVAELLNYTISFVFWATLGRFLLERMVGGHQSFFSGILAKATDPVFAAVGRVVPRAWVPLAVLVLTFPIIGPLRLLLLPLLRAG